MPPTIPIFTPVAVWTMTGFVRSSAVRKVPTLRAPPCSNAVAVRTSPVKPWSMAWLESVVQASYPMVPSQVAICGGAAKTG